VKTTRRFLNGELLEIDAPGVEKLPPSTSVGVVRSGRTELELTSADPAARDFFLESSTSELTSELTLRAGNALRTGAFGGDPKSGTVFSVTVGDEEVFGYAPPAMGTDELASWLSRMTFTATPEGATATLSNGLSWSPVRTFAVAQQVDLSPAQAYLLDVRRVLGASEPPRPEGVGGTTVRGGRLSRSPAKDERRYVVLDAPDAVSYGIPTPSTSLDEVARSMSELTTEVS
jgi:hypothetical protein